MSVLSASGLLAVLSDGYKMYVLNVSIFPYRYGFRLLAGISSIVILANIITVATIIGDENLNPIFPSPIR